jgi:hypothetical protein
MKYQRLAATLALVVLSGCAASQTSAPSAPELSRADAVTEARRDAQLRFNFTPTGVIATRSGQFWLVDMRTADGARAHYAIAADGSIRERRLLP